MKKVDLQKSNGMIMKVIKNLKVKTKVILLAIFLLLVTTIMGFMSINSQIGKSQKYIEEMEVTIRDYYDQSIKFQVENAISLLNEIEEKRLNDEYTMEEAQKLEKLKHL